MNFETQISNPIPFPKSGYVPYHYSSGQFQWYSFSPKANNHSLSSGPCAKYDFSSEPVVPAQDRGPQTVEQLLFQGFFSVPKSEPETAILHDKKHAAWLSLEDVIQQVRHRAEIYSQNMYEIEEGKCYAMNDLYEWEAEMGTTAGYRQREILGKRLQGLYSDQRTERVSFWKDVSNLKQALPESVQNYLSSFRKIELLKDPVGDGP